MFTLMKYFGKEHFSSVLKKTPIVAEANSVAVKHFYLPKMGNKLEQWLNKLVLYYAFPAALK